MPKRNGPKMAPIPLLAGMGCQFWLPKIVNGMDNGLEDGMDYGLEDGMDYGLEDGMDYGLEDGIDWKMEHAMKK